MRYVCVCVCVCICICVCVFEEGYPRLDLFFILVLTTRESARVAVWESTKKNTGDDNGATLFPRFYFLKKVGKGGVNPLLFLFECFFEVN